MHGGTRHHEHVNWCQLVSIGATGCQLVPPNGCQLGQLVPPNDCRKLSQVRKRNFSWHELEIRRKSGHYLAESEVPGKVGAERQTADRGKENRNRWKQLCFSNRVC